MPPGINIWLLLLNKLKTVNRHHLNALAAVPAGKSAIVFRTLYLVQYIGWHLCFGWIHTWKAMRYLAKTDKKNDHRLSFAHIGLMLKFIWLYHIPLIGILQYRLLDYPEQVLDHIYIHEISKWHFSMARDITNHETRFMSDKHYFSEVCDRALISAIKTIAIIPRGRVKIDLLTLLAKRQNLFFKPPSENRSTNCFHLYLKGSTVTLREMNRKEEYTVLEEIEAMLINVNSKHPILVQPLLQNIPQWDELSRSEELITMRIITELYKQEIVVLSSVLEIPIEDGGKYYDVIPINPLDGTIHHKSFNTRPIGVVNDRQQALLTKIAGTKVPFWSTLIDQLYKAHEQCPNIRMVGWDACMTEDGPVIIEGNFGWGTHSLTANELAVKKLMDIEI